MKVTLSPNWDLTTEHPEASSGRPVLVNRATGDAFGPGDPVQIYELEAGYMPAHVAVRSLAKAAELNTAERALVKRFVGSGPPR
jgi:hypothetical protein